MRMNTRRSLIALPLLAGLVACGQPAPPQQGATTSPPPAAASSAPVGVPDSIPSVAAVPQVLEAGQSWTLIDARDAGLKSAAAAAGIFIEVQDVRVVGYAGCNRFSAPLQRGDGNAVQIDAAVATKRACAEDALNVAEQAFLGALPAVQSFELSVDRLRLRDASSDVVLEFSPGRPDGGQGEASQSEGS